MTLDAIHELITAAKALSPSGEIGDGKVAHFYHLTVTQRRIAQCPHGEPLASGCRDCDREHREATA